MRNFISFIIMGFLPIALCGETARPTVLQMDPEAVELGRQTQHEVIEREVKLTNTSDKPLEIITITADCGCTTHDLADTRLAPGAATTLKVRFESRSYVGPIKRRIHLRTDAGEFSLPLSVSVAPYKDWDVSSLPLIVPSALADAASTLRFTVRSVGDPAGARITGASTNQPWLEAAVSPVIDGAQTVTLERKPGAPVGVPGAVLTLATDAPGSPALVFNVIVPVASSLRLSPNPVVLPRTKPGVAASAEFRLLGWRGPGVPELRTSRGEIEDLGEKTPGERAYRLYVKPEAAGTLVWSLLVLREGKTELDVPVMLHVAD